LVAVASMLIATKYEEIYPPLLKDLVFITDNVFTADEILEMELDILVALDFNIQLTTSYRFLERFSKITKIDSVTFFIA
jgi:cyclin B